MENLGWVCFLMREEGAVNLRHNNLLPLQYIYMYLVKRITIYNYFSINQISSKSSMEKPWSMQISWDNIQKKKSIFIYKTGTKKVSKVLSRVNAKFELAVLRAVSFRSRSTRQKFRFALIEDGNVNKNKKNDFFKTFFLLFIY